MKNLLQNKVVVSCLAVIAGLAIAANVVKFPVLSAAGRQPTGAQTGLASQPVQEKFEMPPPLAIREQLISWQAATAGERLPRDPFAWSAGAILAPSTNLIHSTFKLQAISIDADQALAVLNQRVVSVGENFGEYVVERILPTEVWMRGPAGRIVVRLAR